ncbi:hypothetical protein [Lichenibacterium dinghuense]|uniref:hypothetical protein n=1 Tax=Lichenibacterium dinghuense TaxID=2895977 RepID=UPI001F4396AF|nr:hypothetical protein [Lichenibacterium sp. 6Y81]
MNVELKPESARWVEAELSSGRFETAQDAIDHAVALARSGAIRAEIEAADAAGGEFTSEEVLSYVDQHLASIFPDRRG